MAKDNSFDIVSKTDFSEIENALNQTRKELSQRFDFKGSKTLISVHNKELIISAEDETRLRNLNDVMQQKLVRRGVSLKALHYQPVEPAAGGTVRQMVQIQQGIPQDEAREIVKFVKKLKLKIQASVQGDLVRISGKKRDDLQSAMQELKKKDFGIDMQFDNYR